MKIGHKGISGARGDEPEPNYNVFQLVAGKALLPTSVIGIKKVIVGDIDSITLPLISDLNSPGTLPDGVGVAMNLMTSQKVLVYTGIMPVSHDIWVNSLFIAYESVKIQITGSDPAEYQSFYIPIFIA